MQMIWTLTGEWAMFHKVSCNLIFVDSNSTEVLDLSSNFGFVKLAGTISPSIRVVLLGFQATRFRKVAESCSHQATIASSITCPWFIRVTLQLMTREEHILDEHLQKKGFETNRDKFHASNTTENACIWTDIEPQYLRSEK
jgi:hypothetical protein